MTTILGQGQGTSRKFSPSRDYHRLLGGFLSRGSQRPELPGSVVALTESIASAEERSTIIDPRGKIFEEPDRDVAILER